MKVDVLKNRTSALSLVSTLMFTLICSGLSVSSASVMAMTPIELLSKLDDARNKNSFSGTFIHRRGDNVSSYNIVRSIKDGVKYERLKSLDGAPRELLRDGDSVTCIFPEDAGSRWDQIPPISPLVPGENIDWLSLQQWLDFTILAHDRIAGREAIIIDVKSKDNDRFIRRYGLDQETGILLKTEILDLDGHSLELVKFSQIDVNPDGIEADLAPTMKGKKTTFEQEHWEKDSNHQKTWKPTWLPKGFELKGISLDDGHNRFVEAYTYSDGLSSFSLFRETPSAQFVEMEGRGGGATVAVSRITQTSAGDHWGITLVGEIPVETAKRVTSSVSMLE